MRACGKGFAGLASAQTMTGWVQSWHELMLSGPWKTMVCERGGGAARCSLPGAYCAPTGAVVRNSSVACVRAHRHVGPRLLACTGRDEGRAGRREGSLFAWLFFDTSGSYQRRAHEMHDRSPDRPRHFQTHQSLCERSARQPLAAVL